MVRTFSISQFRSPWPLIKKGRKGQRKIGPVLEEKLTWPSQKREFPELNPKWYGTNPKQLHSKLFYYRQIKFEFRLYGSQTSWLSSSRDGRIHFGKENESRNDCARLKQFPTQGLRFLQNRCWNRKTVSLIKVFKFLFRQTAYERLVKKKGSEELADLHAGTVIGQTIIIWKYRVNNLIFRKRSAMATA